MKLNLNFTGKLFACATALVLASLNFEIQAQTMKQGSATVYSIRGSAKYSQGGGVWVPLKTGTVLKPGAMIQTAPESAVDLNLKENGPVIRIAPNTTVSLDKLAFAGTGVEGVIDTKLNVQSGTLIGSVKKLARASKYEIKTPNGVAGIRGTDYVVSVKKLADGTYEVTFTSVTGTLVVAAMVKGNPETVVLNNGESWTPGSDVVPTPRQLLDFYRSQVAQALKGLPPGYDHAAPPGQQAIEQYVSPNHGVRGQGQGQGEGFTSK